MRICGTIFQDLQGEADVFTTALKYCKLFLLTFTTNLARLNLNIVFLLFIHPKVIQNIFINFVMFPFPFLIFGKRCSFGIPKIQKILTNRIFYDRMSQNVKKFQWKMEIYL